MPIMTITDLKPGHYAIHFRSNGVWGWHYTIRVRVELKEAEFESPSGADGVRVVAVTEQLARKHGVVDDLPPLDDLVW